MSANHRNKLSSEQWATRTLFLRQLCMKLHLALNPRPTVTRWLPQILDDRMTTSPWELKAARSASAPAPWDTGKSKTKKIAPQGPARRRLHNSQIPMTDVSCELWGECEGECDGKGQGKGEGEEDFARRSEGEHTSCICRKNRGYCTHSPLFRTEFIPMIGGNTDSPVQTQYLFLRTSTGDRTEIKIFRSIFVIKWPRRKVNQNIHTELKLTSPLLIPPCIFHVLGRDSWCARLSLLFWSPGSRASS